ncbi:hypothetical protein ACFLZV_04690 [Candidatus Margulisiibacteriota bacterium]
MIFRFLSFGHEEVSLKKNPPQITKKTPIRNYSEKEKYRLLIILNYNQLISQWIKLVSNRKITNQKIFEIMQETIKNNNNSIKMEKKNHTKLYFQDFIDQILEKMDKANWGKKKKKTVLARFKIFTKLFKGKYEKTYLEKQDKINQQIEKMNDDLEKQDYFKCLNRLFIISKIFGGDVNYVPNEMHVSFLSVRAKCYLKVGEIDKSLEILKFLLLRNKSFKSEVSEKAIGSTAPVILNGTLEQGRTLETYLAFNYTKEFITDAQWVKQFERKIRYFLVLQAFYAETSAMRTGKRKIKPVSFEDIKLSYKHNGRICFTDLKRLKYSYTGKTRIFPEKFKTPNYLFLKAQGFNSALCYYLGIYFADKLMMPFKESLPRAFWGITYQLLSKYNEPNQFIFKLIINNLIVNDLLLKNKAEKAGNYLRHILNDYLKLRETYLKNNTQSKEQEVLFNYVSAQVFNQITEAHFCLGHHFKALITFHISEHLFSQADKVNKRNYKPSADINNNPVKIFYEKLILQHLEMNTNSEQESKRPLTFDEFCMKNTNTKHKATEPKVVKISRECVERHFKNNKVSMCYIFETLSSYFLRLSILYKNEETESLKKMKEAISSLAVSEKVLAKLNENLQYDRFMLGGFEIKMLIPEILKELLSKPPKWIAGLNNLMSNIFYDEELNKSIKTEMLFQVIREKDLLPVSYKFFTELCIKLELLHLNLINNEIQEGNLTIHPNGLFCQELQVCKKYSEKKFKKSTRASCQNLLNVFNSKFDRNRSFLHVAIENEMPWIVAICLYYGMNINYQDLNGVSPKMLVNKMKKVEKRSDDIELIIKLFALLEEKQKIGIEEIQSIFSEKATEEEVEPEKEGNITKQKTEFNQSKKDESIDLNMNSSGRKIQKELNKLRKKKGYNVIIKVNSSHKFMQFINSKGETIRIHFSPGQKKCNRTKSKMSVGVLKQFLRDLQKT